MNLKKGTYGHLEQLCYIFVMSEGDERNPTALRAGSRMDTDEGTIHKFTTMIITFRLSKNILLYIVLGFTKSKRNDKRTSKSDTQSRF